MAMNFSVMRIFWKWGMVHFYTSKDRWKLSTWWLAQRPFSCLIALWNTFTATDIKKKFAYHDSFRSPMPLYWLSKGFQNCCAIMTLYHIRSMQLAAVIHKSQRMVHLAIYIYKKHAQVLVPIEQYTRFIKCSSLVSDANTKTRFIFP